MSSINPKIFNLSMFVLILISGAVLYAHTLQVPWYFDDHHAIVDNPAIRDLTGSFRGLLGPRGIAMFSFALNYHLGGLEVAGFHLFNIAIHLLCAGLVYLILQRVFRDDRRLPLLGALLFVAHPVQTQAVTYIVQRMTSLCGLFFFLALYLFIRAWEEWQRGDGRVPARFLAFYLGALLCGFAAVSTKENAAVLPLALLLFQRYFLPAAPSRGGWKTALLAVAPFALAPAWAAWQQLGVPLRGGVELVQIGITPMLATLEHISPLHYLVTQFSVLWLYIRLLFLPYGQMLDYGYPVVAELWTLRNLVAGAGLAALGALAWWLRRRRPLVSFGIAWFFLTLAVESTVIPLDPIFEHRLYIPLFGFVVLLLGLVASSQKSPWPLAALGLFILVMAGLTVQRNALWNDQLVFLQDNHQKAPHHERVMYNLAKAYYEIDRFSEAELLLQKSLQQYNRYPDTHLALASLYKYLHRPKEAVQVLTAAVEALGPRPDFLTEIGILHDLLGDPQEGSRYLAWAVEKNPNHAKAHASLSKIFADQQRWPEAGDHARRSLAISDNPIARYNLGVVLYAEGKLVESLREFQHAVRQNPQYANAVFNVASILLELGDVAGARALVPHLLALNPLLAAELRARLTEYQR